MSAVQVSRTWLPDVQGVVRLVGGPLLGASVLNLVVVDEPVRHAIDELLPIAAQRRPVRSSAHTSLLV